MKKTIEKIRHAPAKIRIGKKGVTEGIIMEVEILLKKEQAVIEGCNVLFGDEISGLYFHKNRF